MTTAIIIVTMLAVAIIYSEIENKNNKRMKRKRPIEFVIQNFDPTNDDVSKRFTTTTTKGFFHRFGDRVEYNQHQDPVGHTVAIVEDHDGNVHSLDPTAIKFLK